MIAIEYDSGWTKNRRRDVDVVVEVTVAVDAVAVVVGSAIFLPQQMQNPTTSPMTTKPNCCQANRLDLVAFCRPCILVAADLWSCVVSGAAVVVVAAFAGVRRMRIAVAAASFAGIVVAAIADAAVIYCCLRSDACRTLAAGAWTVAAVALYCCRWLSDAVQRNAVQRAHRTNDVRDVAAVAGVERTTMTMMSWRQVA